LAGSGHAPSRDILFCSAGRRSWPMLLDERRSAPAESASLGPAVGSTQGEGWPGKWCTCATFGDRRSVTKFPALPILRADASGERTTSFPVFCPVPSPAGTPEPWARVIRSSRKNGNDPMTKLNTAGRRRLPASDFAELTKRAYPIEDRRAPPNLSACRLALAIGAVQPVRRKLIGGVELSAPDHAAWIRGNCNRRCHERAVCAPSHNCAAGGVGIWQADRCSGHVAGRHDRRVCLGPMVARCCG